nr:cobalt ECF transporter T component CbiQ [Kineosphaera limosa]
MALDNAAWDSPWRERAVRDKAVLALGLVVAALVLPAWPGTVFVALAAAALLLGPARVAPQLLLRCLAAPAVFIAIGGLSVAVTLAWDGGPRLGFAPDSLARAGSLVGHGLAGTLAVLVLAATTPMIDLLSALRRARVPDACVEVAALMYRMLFTLLESVRAIRMAQEQRLGYATRRAGMRSASTALTSVLLRAWQRAARLEEGLVGRGYVDALRTLDPPRHASARFVAASLLLLAAVAALTLLVAGTTGLRLPGWGA